MPSGILTVNAPETFSMMILLSASQKMKFVNGKPTGEPDLTAAKEKKFAVEVAVTYLSENGMRPISEVISVGIIGGDFPTILQGTPVEFDTLRAGVSQPERRDNGRISGGRLWWQGSGLRAVSGRYSSSKSTENAA